MYCYTILSKHIKYETSIVLICRLTKPPSNDSHFLFLLLSVFGFEIVAQSVETDKIPRNYFRNPLDIPMQLSANFGELA